MQAHADSLYHRSPFPRIDEYAFLSDCQNTCLVGPNGGVEWLCLPRPESPSIFGALLDRAAGTFRLGPEDIEAPAARRYIPGTTMLETTWETRTGWVVIRDFLSIGPWYLQNRRSRTHRRTPTDNDAEHMLIRLVHCQHGSVDLTMDCEPVFDYGRVPAVWEYTGDGYFSASAATPDGEVTVNLQSDLRIGFEGRQATARTHLREGDHAFVALSWGEKPLPSNYQDAHASMIRTSEFWRTWLGRGLFPDHPWREYLQRSALTLKGLVYAPTGALLAAGTTSLPESPHGSRNWDYRYSWARDSSFTLRGLYELGFNDEADDFLYFITDVCADADLQVMYKVNGDKDIPESTLDHLTGYDGAQPVRVGNAAYKQEQHDVWGVVLDSVYLHARERDYLPEQTWPVLQRQVEEALKHWQEPDRGIWEVRGEPQHFVSSKLMCWVAADRGARLARLHGDRDLAERWAKAAAEMHEDICAHGADKRGVFTQYYGSTALDASALLMVLFRFLPATDERMRATVLAIADELSNDGMIMRYRTEETDDGLAGDEGAFLICSFWLVSAFVEIGEVARARHMCDRLLSFASPLGLYAEEIDVRNGRHLGNFPQAFTHLALINAVLHVIGTESR
ncbi:MAG: glycoside hydrolase family 15 protein [Mycobacteriales bacterium]